jgi:hypothetical protein
MWRRLWQEHPGRTRPEGCGVAGRALLTLRLHLSPPVPLPSTHRLVGVAGRVAASAPHPS